MKKMLFLTLAVLLLPLVAFAEDLLWQKDVVSQIVGSKFTHDGKYVVVVANGNQMIGKIIKYDVATGEQADTFKLFGTPTANQISCVDLHPTENILITGGYDKKILFWNIETGDTIKSIKTDRGATDIAVYPDGVRFVAILGENDNEDAVVYDMKTLKKV